jgi:hypothetical protein
VCKFVSDLLEHMFNLNSNRLKLRKILAPTRSLKLNTASTLWVFLREILNILGGENFDHVFMIYVVVQWLRL